MKLTSNYARRPLEFVIRDADTGVLREFTSEEWTAGLEGEYAFRYRGELHGLDEFERIDRGISVMVVAPSEGERDYLADWDGVRGDSAWSATLVRIDAEYETVQVADLTW